MNSIKLVLIYFLLTATAFANIDPNSGTVFKVSEAASRAYLVQFITEKLSQTQARILGASLDGLSLEDLKNIKDNPRYLEELKWDLDERSPDDGDEHVSGSK